MVFLELVTPNVKISTSVVLVFVILMPTAQIFKDLSIVDHALLDSLELDWQVAPQFVNLLVNMVVPVSILMCVPALELDTLGPFVTQMLMNAEIPILAIF
jgi:hypothetical protein